MDNLNGIDVLKKIKRFDPNIPIVFLSGQKEISIAVNALKYGALDYIIGKENVDEERITECMTKVSPVQRSLDSTGAGWSRSKKILAGIGVLSAVSGLSQTLFKIR
jgi:FixJ family two-component response regulator